MNIQAAAVVKAGSERHIFAVQSGINLRNFGLQTEATKFALAIIKFSTNFLADRQTDPDTPECLEALKEKAFRKFLSRTTKNLKKYKRQRKPKRKQEE